MRRLHRTLAQNAGLAPSVPGMYPSLAQRDIAFRIGEVSLIAGLPASGKSSFAMAFAMRAKVSCLYFSADTHAFTMGLRTIAMLTDTDQSVVEPAMVSDPAWASEMLAAASHIRWSFDSAPSVASIEREVLAHIELFSRAPQLLIIDNLMDVVTDGENEFSGMRKTLLDLKWIARNYDCAIVVLAHMSEGVQVPQGQCPPRYALQGKVAQTPALVLSITQDSAGFLGVCPVKNRYGPSCPSGTDVSWLRYNPASMQISEVEEQFHGF